MPNSVIQEGEFAIINHICMIFRWSLNGIEEMRKISAVQKSLEWLSHTQCKTISIQPYIKCL